MEHDKLSALEAILFAYGEPLTAKKIAALLNCDEKEAREYCEIFAKKLADDATRGLRLLSMNGEFQLATKTEHATLIATLVKSETQAELTRAAEETLAIIAYGGPIGRADIDYVRGVNSSFILRNLALRGLIDREIDPHRANAYRYTLSFHCLKHLGIANVETLPQYAKYRKLIEQLHFHSTGISAPTNPTQQ